VTWPEQPAGVRAPATSANLGPGFDAFGLALTLHDVVEVRVTGGGLAIEVSGEGSGTAGLGERHLVVRALRAGFGVLGTQPPGLALSCTNAIPHGRGLGSSAAAIVSGLLAARALVRDGAALLPDERLFRLAAGLEGHPDNVAACLAGGFTIAWTGAPGEGVPAGGSAAANGGAAGGGPALAPGAAGAGAPRLVALPVADGLAPVVCVPPEPIGTEEARRALPATVPHADAAANAARAALLVAALTRDPGLLLDATEDYLHQRYRAPVMPHTADLVSRLRAAGVAAVVSGAGPSVLAFSLPGQDDVPLTVDSITRETGIAWHVIPLDIDRYGATVQPAWPGAQLPDGARRVRSWNPQAQDPRARPAGASPQDNATSAVRHGQL
jgi:homoserine kinase